MRQLLGRPWGWVAAAPTLCAVHCAATPLLLLAVPAFGVWRGVEITLLAITAALALVALTVGFRRHRRAGPAVAALAGLGLWGASSLHLLHQAPELTTTMAGALVAAGALVRNSQLLCLSLEPDCGCTACEEDGESGKSGDSEEDGASMEVPARPGPSAAPWGRTEPAPGRSAPGPAGGLSPVPPPGSVSRRREKPARNPSGGDAP